MNFGTGYGRLPQAMLLLAGCLAVQGCGGDDKTSACVDGAMQQVPGGVFWMGCNEATLPECDGDCLVVECQQDEYPYHEVTVPDFEIDQCEVTVASYARCVEEKACTEPSTYSQKCNWGVVDKEQHPINCVDWDQAAAFCAWEGKRLCTEAEWEKAARGGCELYSACEAESPLFPWSDGDPSCGLATFLGCNCNGTCQIGSSSAGASPYGVYDMSGNVWEWVQDTYFAGYDGAPDDGSAWDGGNHRVYRGGGWISMASALRVSNRVDYEADMLNDALGFRCCK